MKHFFQCTNLQCRHTTHEYKNMRMNELYKRIEENCEAEVVINSGKTVVSCPKCFSEMVYVSLG